MPEAIVGRARRRGGRHGRVSREGGRYCRGGLPLCQNRGHDRRRSAAEITTTLSGAAGGDRAAEPWRADLVHPRQEDVRFLCRPPSRRPAVVLVRRAGRRAGDARRTGPRALLRPSLCAAPRLARRAPGRAARLGPDRRPRRRRLSGRRPPAAGRAARRPLRLRMRSRFLPAACLALALLGLAAGLYEVHSPPGPRGDEATHVLMVQSLWHDHDLAYDQRDLLRGYQVWNRGPSGLTLFTPDGGKSMYFGEPFAYALAALPFYALLGVQGIVVLNMALFLTCAGAAWCFFREKGTGVLLAGFFFASAAFGYVFRLEPAVFTLAPLFFPLPPLRPLGL